MFLAFMNTCPENLNLITTWQKCGPLYM